MAPSYFSPKATVDMTGDGANLNGTLTIRPGARVSIGVLLAPYGGSIEIGERVFLGPYTVVYGHGGLKIGNDVLIAGHCTIIPANHSFENPSIPIREQAMCAIGVKIEAGVWIGTGVRVLDGVTIGAGSVIGAGAVVTQSIPPMSIAVGVPARVIGRRNRQEKPEAQAVSGGSGW